MNWLKDVMTKCLPLKIELIKTRTDELNSSFLDQCLILNGSSPTTDQTEKKKLVFICAKTPDNETLATLLDLVPNNLECLFIETVKSSTPLELAFLVQQSGGVMTFFEPKGHHVEIKIKGSLPPTDDPVWADVQEILVKDGYADSWEIKINDEKIVYDAKMAREMESHNIRDRGFTDSDLTDLKIMLESTNTVDEFLATLERKKGDS
jgi:hypothetical protein